MKYFKTKASPLSPRYEITADSFAKAIGNKFPYEQRNISNRVSQYGICPSCNNPIQLIGMVHTKKVSPYGKHTGKNIKGLASWNQTKYEYCPFAQKNARKIISDDEPLLDINNDVVELYELLKSQFDKVVYIISNELDIRCSSKFWIDAVKQYVGNGYYCYPWLTEVNLPYIFAYFSMRHKNIFGQQVRIDSDLYRTLDKYCGIKFLNMSDSNYARISNEGVFISLEFRFTNHRQKAKTGAELQESFLFCIDDINNRKTVFQKTIEFNETYFPRIIAKSNIRQQYLLDIAEKNMPDITATKIR